MRENNLLDFNMYEQSMSQNVRQPDGAYAERDCPSPTLTTKDITENGEYSAADDGAVGYSSVNVDVSSGGGVGFSHIKTLAIYNGSSITSCEILNSDDGVYEYTSSNTNLQLDNITAFSPLKTFEYIMTNNYSMFAIAFTPHSDFNSNTAFNILPAGSYARSATIDSSSDTITPGDGQRYVASLDIQGSGSSANFTVTIKKKTGNWINVIE